MKSKWFLLLFMFFMAGCGTNPVTVSDYILTWSVETVAGNIQRATTDIVVDSNNKAHIFVLETSSLKYFSNASGTWQETVISTNAADPAQTGIKAAIDNNNKFHLIYYNGKLQYATTLSGTWQFSTIDSTNYAGFSKSIATDTSNNIHVAYEVLLSTQEADIKYAYCNNGTWNLETIESNKKRLNGDWAISLAVDTNLIPHVSYVSTISPSKLKYAYKSSSWQVAEIDTAEAYLGSYCSIAVDSNKKAHIVYSASNDSSYRTERTKYSNNTSGTWSSSNIKQDSPARLDLNIDNNDNLHFAYDLGGNLEYGQYNGTSWRFMQGSNVNIYFPEEPDSRGMFVTSDGAVYFSFIDFDSKKLLFAKGSN